MAHWPTCMSFVLGPQPRRHTADDTALRCQRWQPRSVTDNPGQRSLTVPQLQLSGAFQRVGVGLQETQCGFSGAGIVVNGASLQQFDCCPGPKP